MNAGLLISYKIKIILKVVGYTLMRLLFFLLLKALGKLSLQTVAYFCTEWAERLLRMANMEIKVTGAPIHSKPALFVGNHVSYLDIPVVMSQVYCVFVSKKEVGNWPVFGQAATAVGTIYVDRSSYDSRKSVAMAIGAAMEQNNRSICIFPEGTSSIWGRPWKKGSFQIADRYNFPIQAFALKYSPPRACAFIDDDALLPSLWNLLGHRRISVEIEFKEVMYLSGQVEKFVELQNWAQERVKTFLEEQGLEPEIKDLPLPS